MNASLDYEGRMACARKVAFVLRRDAEAVVRFGRCRVLNVYGCDWCGQFHIGHDRLTAALATSD